MISKLHDMILIDFSMNSKKSINSTLYPVAVSVILWSWIFMMSWSIRKVKWKVRFWIWYFEMFCFSFPIIYIHLYIYIYDISIIDFWDFNWKILKLKLIIVIRFTILTILIFLLNFLRDTDNYVIFMISSSWLESKRYRKSHITSKN